MNGRLTQRERDTIQDEINRLECRDKGNPKIKMLKRRIQLSEEANARDAKKDRWNRTF